jgi:four helix bundle protein
MKMNKNFRSATLAKSLYQQCHRLNLKGTIRDQLERASLSIYLNLVEGSAKPTKKEQTRFFSIALGSLREVEALLDLVDAKKELELADKTGAHIYCLIRSQGP